MPEPSCTRFGRITTRRSVHSRRVLITVSFAWMGSSNAKETVGLVYLFVRYGIDFFFLGLTLFPSRVEAI